MTPRAEQPRVDRPRLQLARVQPSCLARGLDDRTPLLERAKFLAIFASNLDEFFMKRMTLIQPFGRHESCRTGAAREALLIREMILALSAELAACYTDDSPAARCSRIHLLEWAELTRAQQDEVSAVFDTESRRC